MNALVIIVAIFGQEDVENQRDARMAVYAKHGISAAESRFIENERSDRVKSMPIVLRDARREIKRSEDKKESTARLRALEQEQKDLAAGKVYVPFIELEEIRPGTLGIVHSAPRVLEVIDESHFLGYLGDDVYWVEADTAGVTEDSRRLLEGIYRYSGVKEYTNTFGMKKTAIIIRPVLMPDIVRKSR